MKTYLEEYIDYYKDLNDPGYAVLVTGAWGIGKTFQVRKCLSEDDYYYVSLFGLTSTDEIHAAVLAAAVPALATTDKVLSGIGKTGEKVGGYFSIAGLLPLVTSAIMRQSLKPDKTLVFDDLERSCLDLKDLLGVINTYVEHHKFRVITITHEEKIQKGFEESKEKIFGQTILALPQVDEAFEEFVSGVSDQGLSIFLRNQKKNIIRVFKDSGAMSLRILRHIIEDIGRLYSVLAEAHIANSQAMTEIVLLFCALNIEVRIGRLNEDDLRNRVGCELGFRLKQQSGSSDDQIQMPKLLESNERYPLVDLEESNLLNDDALVQMFIEGRYLEKSIRNSVDSSSYFQKLEDKPPWKIIYRMYQHEFEAVETAANDMQKQFENREVIKPGEMLHIFSLRMMMFMEGLLDEGYDEIVSSCKAYIDDLLQDERLQPWDPKEATGRPPDSFNGCGYWVIDVYKENFHEVESYLLDARKKAFEKKFPNIARELLGLVKTDGQQFFEKVCHTNNGENPFMDIPILKHINPSEFVDAWLKGSGDNRHVVSLALKGRYTINSTAHKEALISEFPWAVEVFTVLQTEAAMHKGIRALQIRKIIPNELYSLLDDIEEQVEN